MPSDTRNGSAIASSIVATQPKVLKTHRIAPVNTRPRL